LSNAETAITPDMTVNGLLYVSPQSAAVFIAHGMACVGCPLAGFHTLAEAAATYGQDLASFLTELNVQHSEAPSKGDS
jgi:hybrid cluster-associated redox disulfide protein